MSTRSVSLAISVGSAAVLLVSAAFGNNARSVALLSVAALVAMASFAFECRGEVQFWVSLAWRSLKGQL